jgi:hypothetical protein
MHPAVRVGRERGLVAGDAALAALEDEKGAAQHRGVGLGEQHVWRGYLGVARQRVHDQCLSAEVVFVDDAERTRFDSDDEALPVVEVDEEGIGGGAVADGSGRFRDGGAAKPLGDPRRQLGTNLFGCDPSDDRHSQTSFRRIP